MQCAERKGASPEGGQRGQQESDLRDAKKSTKSGVDISVSARNEYAGECEMGQC